MIANKLGESIVYEGITYRIGDRIVASGLSEYNGLRGSIIEIRDGIDRETENETLDIYCSFEDPISPQTTKELEETFSSLYGIPKTIDDIALDLVILAPEMIKLPKNEGGFEK